MLIRPAVLALTVIALSSCSTASVAEPVAAITSGDATMIHGWFRNQTYAQLVTNGHVPAGSISIDLYDPPIVGGPTAGLLWFDAIGADGGRVPPGSVVHRAELTLTTTNAGAGARLHRLLQPWSDGITWAGSFGGNGIQADDVEARAAADVDTGVMSLGAHTFDVTAAVQAWADGAANYGWALLPLGVNGWDLAVFDAIDEAQRPRLSVLFGPPAARVMVATGDVMQTSVVVLVQPTLAGNVDVRVARDPAFSDLVAEFQSPVPNVSVPLKTELINLTAGTRYYVEARDAGGASRVATFVTPAPVDERRGLRFGVTGDWRGELAPYPAVSNVASRQLDFFVALGDTIYADVPSPAVPAPQCLTLDDFRRKHAEVYADALGQTSLADIRATTAWFSDLDDHEVTNDFAGGADPNSHPLFAGADGEFINQTPLFEAALQAFHEQHPIAEEIYGDTGDARTAGRRKLYRARRFGRDAAVFMLDARSFRDEEIPGLLDLGGSAEQFFQDSFEPGRTMLGAAQLEELQDDLLAAGDAGVTWKFVLVPEPIQNLGPLMGEDRFEGYAWERTQLLRFIDEHDIRNVVFIAADIHCTIVNNIEYQLEYGQPQILTDTWEISTGAVAYAAPFGPTVASIVAAIPVFGPLFELLYNSLDRDGKDQLLAGAMNSLLEGWGLDPIGLDGSGIPATLLAGSWVSLHTYGWTEFSVDSATQRLTVTTYGIDWYDRDELLADPVGVVSRTPQIVSQFVVDAVIVPPPCAGDLNGDAAVNLEDLSTLLSHFGQVGGATLEQGDIDGDGNVTLADLSALLEAFGTACAG